jgi:glycerophosphoryl diester phosphodiesterase
LRPLVPGTRPPWAVAHRGDSAARPENTPAAFDAALAARPDGIELDLQRSRDGVPVVWHDRSLRKLGLPRRRVAGLTVAELHRLDAGAWFDKKFAGQRVPTLDAVLERYGGRTALLLEVKLRGGRPAAMRHRALAEAAAEALEARGLLDAAFLLCFGMGPLEAARARVPGARCVLNLDQAPPRTAAFRRAAEGLAALCVNVRALDARLVAEAHGLGKPVLTFTCNTPEAVDRALSAGADGILSDRPGWLQRRLSGRGGDR